MTRMPPCGAQPGDVLAQRYQLDAVLGWGGQAVVFRATDLLRASGRKRSTRYLALKIVRTDLRTDLYQEAVDALRWEAHLMRRVHHQALPRLVAFFTDSSITWIARELVDGRPLAAWAGLCDPTLVHTWAVQLCDLLRYLHSRTPPIICGDLKPDNLVVRADHSLVLIDLGAVQVISRHPASNLRPRYGTPGYAAPEQMANLTMDERSDLFSLGVICYELLTGSDPADAPLQFDLASLDELAPLLAPALRWALELDPERRAPTASVLRAMLATPLAVSPLGLGRGVQVATYDELLHATAHHPHLIERALERGNLDAWLAVHTDQRLGHLLHHLRTMRDQTPPYPRTIDRFLAALAPDEQSPTLHRNPRRIDFGTIPLRKWQAWSRPQQLALQNSATRRPVRWELHCPPHEAVDVCIQVTLPNSSLSLCRHAEGILLPGENVTLALVANGSAGQHYGTLMLRCGADEGSIPWQATTSKGLPLGERFITRLDELDLSQPDLLPALETLLADGALQRWLRAQGERTLAHDLRAADRKALPEPLRLRLLAARLLHHLDPLHIPLLDIAMPESPQVRVVAGEPVQYALEIENQGHHPWAATWISSNWPWVRVISNTLTLPPATPVVCTIWLMPPATLPARTYAVTLDLQVGNLVLPVPLTVHVVAKGLLRRLREWFG